MFIHEKKNKSGSTSVQVLEKVGRKNRLLKTIGIARSVDELFLLRKHAEEYINSQQGQLKFNLKIPSEEDWFNQVFSSIRKVQLIGPELILGHLFETIGFHKIQDDLFRHLVISRIIYPSSKLKTVRYLQEYRGLDYDVNKVYRYLDKLKEEYKELIEQISYQHTIGILKGNTSVVFYDVTTIYFEAEREDELRMSGFSKEGKHQNPQILLGLLVSVDGYPLAYEIFEGKKYEGHTMLPVVETFKKRFNLHQLVLIADAGMLNTKNVEELIEKDYEFILGARLKTESQAIKNKILGLTLKDGESRIIKKTEKLNLVISYTKSRATKDVYNRSRGLKKLEKALSKGKLTKQHINNRGYNKYLQIQGDINISIDYSKFEADSKWDGLKGYLTNTTLKPQALIKNYNELWKIERAFRISKTDLKIRPIYHRVRRRIEAHICISFAAYKLYKELDRQLKLKKVGLSTQRAIEVMKTIFSITIQHPKSKIAKTQIVTKTQIQTELLEKFGQNSFGLLK